MGEFAPDQHDPAATRPIQTQQVLDQLARAEAQFDQVKQGLAQLQRLSTLGTLTATVAHEFNNLLTPVISYAQLALSKPDDVELSLKAHQKAIEGAERASQLCASLLGYARQDEHPARTSLRSSVDASLNCLGRGLEKDGIHLVLDLPEVEVAISTISLEQVLVNLVLNARKAMRGRAGTLTIRAQAGPNAVQLEVADTGRGVPPEVADRLFEPFVTCGMGPNGTGEQGTGLGLSVCRDLVRSAGGEIRFISTLGSGTTFIITLPRVQPLRRSA